MLDNLNHGRENAHSLTPLLPKTDDVERGFKITVYIIISTAKT